MAEQINIFEVDNTGQKRQGSASRMTTKSWPRSWRPRSGFT